MFYASLCRREFALAFSGMIPVHAYLVPNQLQFDHFCSNKTKYFKLCLSDEVSTERPERDLRLT